MLIYMTAALFGYLEFRANTATNILLNYGDDDVLMQVVRIGALAAILCLASHQPPRVACMNHGPMALAPLVADEDDCS